MESLVKFYKKKLPDGSLEVVFRNPLSYTSDRIVSSINSKSLRVTISDPDGTNPEMRSYRQALIVAPELAHITATALSLLS